MAATRINFAATLLVIHPDGTKVRRDEIDRRLRRLLDEYNSGGGQPNDFYLAEPQITIGPSIVKE